MSLHTIMRPEAVFQGQEDTSSAPLKELVLQGIRIEVSERPDRTCIIQRIISSNPADYLNPALQPGIVLHLIHTPRP